MTTRQIPAPLIAALSEVVPEWQTHAGIDTLFMHADAPGDPPDANKQIKVQEWLRRSNRQSDDPLAVVGLIIEGIMEQDEETEHSLPRKVRIEECLRRCGLQYVTGGRIASGASLPSLGLADLIRSHDLTAVENEFRRALENLESSPREAVSAACNILESICKCYIEVNGLEMPRKKDIKSVWSIVKKKLGFEPGVLEDDDLRKIVSGMLNAVDGIGSLRTHASSAHGQGRSFYRLESRHARLAVNAAHTVSMFVLETWQKRAD
ncbi:MAG: abortive infection family protein [Acidobacteriota bacterium]